jgi:hypothetical protein
VESVSSWIDAVFRSSALPLLPLGAVLMGVVGLLLSTEVDSTAAEAAMGAVVSVASPPRWRCLLRFGHKWRRSVNEGAEFQRCVRCGKEREMPIVPPYSGMDPTGDA